MSNKEEIIMKTIIATIALLTLLLSTASYARCKDVGNVLLVTQQSGYTTIETSDGYFVLSGSRAVSKSPGRERACYNNKTNKFCYPTPGGTKCEELN